MRFAKIRAVKVDDRFGADSCRLRPENLFGVTGAQKASRGGGDVAFAVIQYAAKLSHPGGPMILRTHSPVGGEIRGKLATVGRAC